MVSQENIKNESLLELSWNSINVFFLILKFDHS